MFGKNLGMSEKCTMFEYADTNQEWKDRLTTKSFDESHILICGSTGSGKSSLLNNVTRKFYEHPKTPYKVFYLTEKKTGEWANAYWGFHPTEKYHLARLRLQGEKPKTYPVHLLHPAFLPQDYKGIKSLPNIDFFTLDITKISDDSFATILGGDEDKESVKICVNTARKLSQTDDLFDFLWRVRQTANKDDDDTQATLEIDEDDELFMAVKPTSDSRTVSKVVDSFKDFLTDFCLMPSNAETNLNMLDVLNDQERVSVLSMRWVKSTRVRFFIYVQLLHEILETLRTGKVKHPLLLVFEEMKILLPASKTESVSYEKMLTKFLSDMLPQIRTGGKGVTVLATTQSINYTNESFMSNFNEKIIMPIDPTDKKSLYRSGLFDLKQLNTISGLRKHCFVLWSEVDRAKYEDIY